MTDPQARFKDVTPNGSGQCFVQRFGNKSLRIGRREDRWQRVRFFRVSSWSCAETLT